MRRTWKLRHVRLSAIVVDMQTQGECCASMHAPQVHWLAQVSAVLGDMEKTAGTIRVSGSIAYVAQSAWIINDTPSVAISPSESPSTRRAMMLSWRLPAWSMTSRCRNPLPSPIRIEGIQDLADASHMHHCREMCLLRQRACILWDETACSHGGWKAHGMRVDLCAAPPNPRAGHVWADSHVRCMESQCS